MKKIIFIVVILVLIGGGSFYWWSNQRDVRALNETLPDGVKVEKTILGFGKEYKVKNEIDDYEFKVPAEWKGIKEIEYIPERTEEGYTGTSLNIEGMESIEMFAGIDQFTAGGDMSSDLKSWAENQSSTLGFMGDFTSKELNGLTLITTQENVHLGGVYTYFFRKNSIIYSITGISEEFITYVILNGKW